MSKKIKLNEHDTKHTLSSMKKAKPPKTVLVKNVADYWPVLDENQIEKFSGILKQYLTDESNKQFFTIGLESTLRHLKSNPAGVDFLVIADEISPKWFGKHLISMALAKNPRLKIAIVNKLKDHTKKLLNVPAIVFSLKMTENKIFDEFYSDLNVHEQLLKNYCTVRVNSDTSIKRKKKKKKTDEKDPEIVHLKKSEAFVPSSSRSEEPMQVEDSLDFISLSKYDDPSLVSKSAPVSSYRPLKVKKIVGNLLRRGK